MKVKKLDRGLCRGRLQQFPKTRTQHTSPREDPSIRVQGKYSRAVHDTTVLDLPLGFLHTTGRWYRSG